MNFSRNTIVKKHQGIKLYKNRNYSNLVIAGIPPITYNTTMLIKFINGVLNLEKIKSILEKMNSHWNTLTDETEIKILNDYYSSGKHLNLIYLYMVWITLVSYMFFPLAPIVLDFIRPLNESRSKNPLYLVELYIDQDKYFYSVLTHSYITSLAGVLPLFASDLLFSNCAHHACGMLEILGRRVENIMNEKHENKEGECKKIDEYKQAFHCVVTHQNIIDFCNSINEIYNIPFFLILIIELVEMSVTSVAAVMYIEDNLTDSIRNAMFTTAQIFHLFCYFFLGQHILNYSEKLMDNAYNFQWYAASAKTKYIIKFMIMRSLKPSVISAAHFPLTLENFTSLMKTVFSYFTVMNSTR